jgi:hypothetical protein
MNFKSRTLGLAVVATLAMSAILVSAASASNFTASKYPTAGTATSAKGNDDFKTEAGSVECKAHFASYPLSEPSPFLTVTPTYSECQAFGFLSATVTMNGCDYIFEVGGEVALICPPKNVIRIVASTCEATIGEAENEEFLSSIAFTNSGSGISAKANVGGIAYEVTKDGFLCPFAGKGAKTGATYTQNNAILFSSTNGATLHIG